MQLNSKQIAYLRGLAQALRPVVMIGNNGLTEAVLKEIDSSLSAHELIKVQVAGDDRALRTALLSDIAAQAGAIAVHHIGKQLVFYRASEQVKPQARIVIPT